jgi:glucose-fructose oxidoreductase
VKLAVGYRLHYDLYHREMMRLAREQDFGPFMKMRGDRGFVFGQRAWRIEKKLAGGGPMMDLGIYIVQGACMAANGATPIAVTAQEEPKTKPELFNEVEETIRWTMDFPNGAKCEAVTSFTIVLISFASKVTKAGSSSRNMRLPIAASFVIPVVAR